MTLPISMRRTVALLALLALSFVLLRSACDVLALQLPGSQAESLSALHPGSGTEHTLHAGSHEASLGVLASAAGSKPLATAPVVAALAAATLVFLSRMAAPAASVPPHRSYYARSARIQR